jgi:ATP-binding cassette subfamily B protein
MEIGPNGARVRNSSTLSALAILASRLGVDTSVEQLRRRFALGDAEPSTESLTAMARELGLEAVALTMTFADLPRLAKSLPAILRAKNRGSLLLEDARSDPMKGSVAVIRDPEAPEEELIAVEEVRLAEVWEGEVVLIKRAHRAADVEQPFGLAWLTGQVLRERKIFGDIAVGALVNTVFAIAPAFICMIVVDRVLVNHSYSTLIVLAGAILIMLAFETVLSFLRRLLTQVVTTRIDGRRPAVRSENLAIFGRSALSSRASCLVLFWTRCPCLASYRPCWFSNGGSP